MRRGDLPTLEPPFEAPSAPGKQRNKCKRDEQTVLGSGYVEVALWAKNDVVVATPIDDGSIGQLTPTQVAHLESFEAERICRIEDATSVGAGLLDKVSCPTQSRGRRRNLTCGCRRRRRTSSCAAGVPRAVEVASGERQARHGASESREGLGHVGEGESCSQSMQKLQQG